MILVPFKAEHFLALRPRIQPMQQVCAESMTPELAAGLETLPHTFTALQGDTVMACCGVLKMWEGRAHLWSYLAFDIGRHLLQATREVKTFLDAAPYRRYEAEISEGFEASHRWIKLLGFKCETPEGMENFFDTGARGYLYSRMGSCRS